MNVLVEVKHLLSVDEPQICKLVETDTQPTEGKRGHIVAIENFEGGLIWTMDTQLTMKEWELVPVPKEEKEEGKSDYALVETRKLKIPGSSVPSLFPHPGPVFSITDSEVWASIGDCFGVVELTKDQICLGEVACNQTTNANKSVFTAGVYVAKFGELWVADDGFSLFFFLSLSLLSLPSLSLSFLFSSNALFLCVFLQRTNLGLECCKKIGSS